MKVIYPPTPKLLTILVLICTMYMASVYAMQLKMWLLLSSVSIVVA